MHQASSFEVEKFMLLATVTEMKQMSIMKLIMLWIVHSQIVFFCVFHNLIIIWKRGSNMNFRS